MSPETGLGSESVRWWAEFPSITLPLSNNLVGFPPVIYHTPTGDLPQLNFDLPQVEVDLPQVE
eukprot:919662-Amphidinium_carterae.1